MNYTIEKLSEYFKLTTLDEREIYVLSLRLKGIPLKEIGKNMTAIRESKGKRIDGKLDQERVRQIEAKAIRKLIWYFLRKEVKSAEEAKEEK